MKKLLRILLFPFIFMVNPKLYVAEAMEKREGGEKEKESSSKGNSRKDEAQ